MVGWFAQLNHARIGYGFNHLHQLAITFKFKKKERPPSRMHITKSSRDAQLQQQLQQHQEQLEQEQHEAKAITQYVATGPVRMIGDTLPKCQSQKGKARRATGGNGAAAAVCAAALLPLPHCLS